MGVGREFGELWEMFLEGFPDQRPCLLALVLKDDVGVLGRWMVLSPFLTRLTLASPAASALMASPEAHLGWLSHCVAMHILILVLISEK